jgi:replication fork clamp-binding protein CrfC
VPSQKTSIESGHEVIGTPRDYSDNRYRVYFEVAEVEDQVLQILRAYSQGPVERLTHGYEAVLPLQSVPEVVREISARNIAVYQVVRYAKL